MKSSRVLLLAVLFLVLGSLFLNAEAAPPQLINYQGKLVNGTNLVSGQLSVVLRVYTNATMGGYLFEDSNDVTVVDGLYSVQLGAHPVSGTLTAALAGAEAWIEVEVNGTVLSPREPILSVAYSLNADKLDGVDSSAFATGAALTSEQNARVAADSGLGSSLSSEIAARIGADTSLSGQVSVVSGQLAAETNSRIGADADLSNQLTTVNGQLTGLDTGKVSKTGDTMTGALTLNAGAESAIQITSAGSNVMIGADANGINGGVAVGAQANANVFGVALGYQAIATNQGTSVGAAAEGSEMGAAVGEGAYATGNGAAIGFSSFGNDWGAAIGSGANGSSYGVAAGSGSYGYNNGVALGHIASGSGSNVAIGFWANAGDGGSRIAIGALVENTNDNTIAVRGSLYLDGGSALMYRSSFGSGDWQDLIAERAGSATNFVRKVGDTMTGALAIQDEASEGALVIGGTGQVVQIGGTADATAAGVAVGYGADGSATGAAVGAFALGYDEGAAVGWGSRGAVRGAGVGFQAYGSSEGAALGYKANGEGQSAAVGYEAYAFPGGAAVGHQADGGDAGVAVGYHARGPNGNVAVGNSSFATGVNQIAIGRGVTNENDNSIAVRGDLYLDGGAKVYYRNAFGMGAFSDILLPYAKTVEVEALSNTVYSSNFATNYVRRTGDTMTGMLTINSGAQSILTISNAGTGVAVGGSANGDNTGSALGYYANAYSMGTAVGYAPNGSSYGAAVGANANGPNNGAAVGYYANAPSYGAAVGSQANGFYGGVAMGFLANAFNTNVAIGFGANAAGGMRRIAIGAGQTNLVDNSAALRGTLYLDGGTGILYRSSFGSGGWTDLIADSTTNFVKKTGDTMTDALNINAPAGLVLGSTNSNVIIGRKAGAGSTGVAIGNNATGLTISVAIGNNAAASSGGVAIGGSAGAAFGVAIGPSASAPDHGVAVGESAGASHGVAVGAYAGAGNLGAAVGESADGSSSGAAVGRVANGSSGGAVVGHSANGYNYGAAVGYSAFGYEYGAALGDGANAINGGVAIGYSAYGVSTNIAIGYQANAGGVGATNRIAIGRGVTTSNNNSIAVRGTLYLDGGTGIYYRATFGSGGWSDLAGSLLPLNGSKAMTGDLDMGNHSITNVKTNTIVFADGSHAVRSSGDTITGGLTVQGALTLGGEARSTWPVDASTTNLNMGGNGVTNAGFVGFATNVSFSVWTGAVPALYYKTNSLARLTPDSYTKLLLHMDGANNSTNFVDDSGSALPIKTFGDVRHSTFNPRLGTACAYFDGVGDYIRITNNAKSADFNFGTNDFTIEFFVIAQNSPCCFFSKGYGSQSVAAYEDGSGVLRLHISSAELTAPFRLINGNWTHLAFTRQDGLGRIFANGRLLAEVALAYNITNWDAFAIGRRDYYGDLPLVGYIDEFRVSHGVARYTASFAPPTAPFDTTGTVEGLYFNDGVSERRIQLVDP